MKARVYKSTGSWYQVKDEAGNTWLARTKGKLKIAGSKATNPVAVGDWVIIELLQDEPGHALIQSVCDRNNHMVRSSPHSRFQQHVVAANLDQSVLLATIRSPKTSLGFIDRFLVTAEAYHVPAALIFNKTDLLDADDLQQLEEVQAIYEAIGYPVYTTSLLEQSGLEAIQLLFSNKTTLLTGHSGVGKSTFINYLLPELDLRTQDVSDWSGKGLHTTTFAEMFDLPGGGRIIDTPGIRELGIVDISRQELSHYFPEMRERLQECQFNNCLHQNEPGCAIKESVMSGAIHPDRYASYLGICDTIIERKY